MSAKSPLKAPLERHLAPALDDVALQRVARQVRLAHGARRARRKWALVAVAATVLLALAVVVWPEPKPLGLADGAPLPSSLSGDVQPRVALGEGSFITLAQDARADVVDNQPARLMLLLRSGRAKFEVNPKAHRQWLIEAGAVMVEVVGTVFTVDRTPEGVSVSVERGVVLVRGDALPDRIQRLEAGQNTFVSTPPSVPVDAGAHAAPVSQAPESPLDAGAQPAAPVVQALQSPLDAGPAPRTRLVNALPARAEVLDAGPEPIVEWQPLARAGDFAGAWALLGADGFGLAVAQSKRCDELLLLADVARTTSHAETAAVALERAMNVEAGTVCRGTAAFTLGRLELEVLKKPAAAAAHFERASLEPALTEAALARRVDALRAAGDVEAARAAATDVVARFPNGAQTPALRRWLSSLDATP